VYYLPSFDVSACALAVCRKKKRRATADVRLPTPALLQSLPIAQVAMIELASPIVLLTTTTTMLMLMMLMMMGRSSPASPSPPPPLFE
jgi:hypothetical protein